MIWDQLEIFIIQEPNINKHEFNKANVISCLISGILPTRVKKALSGEEGMIHS